ncbi:DUF935 family protein [Paludibacter sp.]|uniref:phage portal protein family protein n=1 Tax=Paludibacter sp. TaxID=1898105 RepID=UPI0013538F64|nr:DUF935 family protein [Paludibacter sp.]MTK53284.1 DUF935 family protein [Paludibacter sp.]
MAFKDIFRKTPVAEAKSTAPAKTFTSEIAIQIAQEFTDRSRKDIKKWRNAILAAENPDDPRWYVLQDLYDDIMLDAQITSVIDIRNAATLNHRFYVKDKKTGEELPEQTEFFNAEWFFDFLEEVMTAVYRKYSVIQVLRDVEKPVLSIIPRRNVCIQKGYMYTEVAGNKFVDYKSDPTVIEIVHKSPFGITTEVVPNIIWKRNALQSWAEFSEKFGQPLITATTSNKQDIARIQNQLKTLGEAAQAVLPNGTTIQVHDLANAGDPEKCYLKQTTLHDQQISKRFVGSTTMADQGANRSQTEVHERTLDDKISIRDKRFAQFVVNGKLLPVLQMLGFPFDNTTMSFEFDMTEELTMLEHWSIVKDAADIWELDEQEVSKTFRLPIIGKKATQPPVNFKKATDVRAMAVACAITLPDYPVMRYPIASGIDKELLDELIRFDEQFHKLLWNGDADKAETVRLLKAKRIGEDLRDGLFGGWGKSRVDVAWNAPDNRALAMMEMNLFRFSEAKTQAEAMLINRLLIDRDKLEIRSERDFINEALKINKDFNQTYLATEREFCIATGQTSARWFEFIAEKNQIHNWRYQTVGDDHVRDSHRLLNGRIFSFDDGDGRRLWPPNGYKCRCEGLQEPGDPCKNLVAGKDYIDKVFTTPKMKENFAVNRAESGVVFRQNQMYLNDLSGEKSKKTNDYTYANYGLKPWKDFNGTLDSLKLDKSITSDNVREFYTNNAASKGYNAMGFDDYLKRKVILKEKTFESHITGKYVTEAENRHRLFPFVKDVLANPDEVYLRNYPKGDSEQIRYIKFWKDKTLIVDATITGDGLEVQTWYERKIPEEQARAGLYIK